MPRKPKTESETIPVAQPKRMGRPDSFTRERADVVLAHIIEGRSLRTIAALEGMPSVETILKWCRTRPDFTEQYARAKEEQAEAFIEELIDIADDSRNDWIERNDPNNPGWIANGEHIQRAKLRVDARKWIAAKMKPKKYGDVASLQVNIDKQQLMVVMPTAAEATNRVMQLQAPAIEAEVVEPE